MSGGPSGGGGRHAPLPPAWVSLSRLLGRWWLAAAAVAVATVFTLAVMPGFESQYRPAGTPSIIDLEFAGTAERFKEILLAWTAGLPASLSALRRMLFPADFVYPVSYALALASTFAALRRGYAPRAWDGWLVAAAAAAAVFDWIENGMHLLALGGVHTASDVAAAVFPAVPILTATIAATVKFALIGAAVLAVLAAGAVRVLRPPAAA